MRVRQSMIKPSTYKPLMQTGGLYQYVTRAHTLVLGLGAGLVLSSCVATPSKEQYVDQQEEMVAQVEAINFELAVHRTVWRDLYASIEALRGLQGAERRTAEDNITRVIALMGTETAGAVTVNF